MYVKYWLLAGWLMVAFLYIKSRSEILIRDIKIVTDILLDKNTVNLACSHDVGEGEGDLLSLLPINATARMTTKSNPLGSF